jgi:hypothetical protein
MPWVLDAIDENATSTLNKVIKIKELKWSDQQLCFEFQRNSFWQSEQSTIDWSAKLLPDFHPPTLTFIAPFYFILNYFFINKNKIFSYRNNLNT